MRKWAITALTAVLVVSSTGCGSSSDDTAGTTTTPGTTAGTTTVAKVRDALGTEIDDAVEAAMDASAVPGAVVLVRTPEGEYAQAYGTRVAGEDDPVTVDDHFRIGSNTKTMVGTVVLQLVDDGELALDDPVSDYRDDVPDGAHITIEQLLDMSSGLFNYSELASFNKTLDDDPDKAWDPEELVALGLAEDPYFAPGDGFHYSNTNTVLLGLIVEQVTGEPLADVLAEKIYEPLGLDETSFPATDDASIPEPFAHGYLFGTNASTVDDAALPDDERRAALDGELLPNDVTTLNPSWGWAAGAAISTAADLADYVEALVGGGLLGDDLQADRLASVTSTDPGSPDAAGYGWALASFGPYVGHDGSLPGYQSFMGHDPDTDTTLIVLTNLQSGPTGTQTANEIARAVMGEL